MSKVRYDAVSIPQMVTTKEGFLKGCAPISRIGVLKYFHQDGSVTLELRHPDHVFNTESMSTLKMVPITEEHQGGLVSVDNASTVQKGYTGDTVERQGAKLVASMTITDKALINKIKSGLKKDLSAGYTCDVIKEDGVYNGEKYTHIQTNIKYNHVTVTESGRAGAEIRIRTDSIDSAYHINYEEKMEAQELQTKYDSLALEKALVAKENEVLKTRLDAVSAKLENVESALVNRTKELEEYKKLHCDSAIADAAKKRVAILRNAEPYIDLTTYEKHSNVEIMVQTLRTDSRYTNEDFKTKTEAEIYGMFKVFTDEANKNKRLKYDSFMTPIYSSDSEIQRKYIEKLIGGKNAN